jgi:phospholipid/cholesterol/gamma-HCH transport system permease protein
MANRPALDRKDDRLAIRGDWTLPHGRELAAKVSKFGKPDADIRIDASELSRLDTCGALLLLRLLGSDDEDALERIEGLREADAALLKLIAERGGKEADAKPKARGFIALLARMGQALENFAGNARDLLGFVGLTLVTLARTLVGRRRLRLTSTVFHMEQTGLDAVPIVALLSFLVGAVVAFLGATVLRDFGASIFTVELVAYSFLREFGVLLTAILLAGRSGSAFTAQIGSMKSREEVDAIRALGLDVVELLVLPRLLALLVMLPLLSFIAMMSGLIGGALVGAAALDISIGMFISRLYEMTEIRHFWVGISKAPVFAFLIAVVGCLEGLKVSGSAESVGRHTTSAVVQSIFLVILFDAAFAIFFMELDV